MNVLVIGSGGREHALVWKIGQSPKVKKIFCAPGNAGIEGLAECVPINSDNIEALCSFAQKHEIALTIVGPEQPLAEGIVDRFNKAGLKVFGPNQKAAILEASKAFTKTILEKYNIPTAKGKNFTSFDKAEKYVKTLGAPLVVKADGLAAGKGVVVCQSEKEAIDALSEIMKDKVHGEAGKKVVIEEFLTGEEASFMALTDGKTVLPLPAAQDHKTALDDDKGPNTGGMGAYSPAPVADKFMQDKIMKEVMIPTVQAMAAEGRPYKGVLYAGLMIERDKIKVLEFNARFGDPETQPLMMRIKSDIIPLMEAVIDGTLHKHTVEIDDRSTVCVVMAAGGYPGAYEKGKEIKGLSDAAKVRDAVVFHAGTTFKDGKYYTNGGRVLGVTAIADTVEKAIDKAYQAASKISWDGSFYRKDIGRKAVKRLSQPPQVGIVMGSASDLDVMKETVAVLKQFGITYEIMVASAHRTPDKAMDFAKNARSRGMKVIVAGAGHAAHLAGAMAAHSTLPIIGVPIDSSALQGLDALLATVQMPPGVPVATVAIGKPGARNAGVLAAQMISLADEKIAKLLDDFKIEMAESVERQNKKLPI